MDLRCYGKEGGDTYVGERPRHDLFMARAIPDRVPVKSVRHFVVRSNSLCVASPSQSHFPELLMIPASLYLSNSHSRLLPNNFFYALKVAADRITRSGRALLNSYDGA